jgi:hypothetical protein
MSGSKTVNLSILITKLKDAGYNEVEKKFSNNYPQTLEHPSSRKTKIP